MPSRTSGSRRRQTLAIGWALCSTLACMALSAVPAFAALPDGRVYEAVSPVATEGNVDAYVPGVGSGTTDTNGQFGGVITRHPFEVAPNGEMVVYPGDPPATGGGTGGSGIGEGDEYRAVRSPEGGWTQMDLQPEGIHEAPYEAFSSDLSVGILSAFDQQLTSDAPANCQVLFARTRGDEAFHAAFTSTQVRGECDGFPGVEGISADDAHLLFTSETALTPNAIVAQRNLYESVAGQVYLVSILPSGEAASVTLQSVSGSTTNVISPDGSRVYWTDASGGQVYLRVNATQPQSAIVAGRCSEPAKACTLQVSASEKTNGAGSAGSDPDGPKPAEYWAATSDGSQAFLTSAEELTNDADTGPGPTIGRAGLEGAAIVQSFIPAGARAVAVDGSHVYWADPSGHSIGRANLDGTGVEPSFIAGAGNPTGVAVDASHVYWTNAASGREEEGTIGRANLDGSGVDESFIAGASDPQSIAVDASHVYWGNGEENAFIGRADLDGTEVDQSFIAVFGGGPVGFASGIAVDASHIYWSDPVANSIGRANLDGTGRERSFIAGASDPRGVAVDPSHVYWTDAATGTVARAALDGSGAEQSFIAGASNPQGVAVDAGDIYWANGTGDGERNLYRFDAEAPEAERLTDLTTAPGADVQGVVGTSGDGSYVYFAAGGVLASNENDAHETAAPQTCMPWVNEADEGTSCNVYLWHGGVITFITALSGKDQNFVVPFDGEGESNESGDWALQAGYRTTAVTPNGHGLVFMSQASLTGYDNNIGGELLDEVFLYEAGTGTLTCVSCDPSGAPPVPTAFNRIHEEIPAIVSRESVGAFIPITKAQGSQPHVISDDGSRVFFDSAEPLVPQDVNGWFDVYEWERDGAGSCAQSAGCVYLLSGGTSTESSWLLGADASGENVFIITHAQLTAQDRNGNEDVYDARVGGVQPSPQSECSGAGCQGVPPAPPIFATPSSVTFNGIGNFPPVTTAAAKPKAKAKVVKCRKGLVRKHSRCVRKKAVRKPAIKRGK
jgi:virginiamycin B lyase